MSLEIPVGKAPFPHGARCPESLSYEPGELRARLWQALIDNERLQSQVTQLREALETARGYVEGEGSLNEINEVRNALNSTPEQRFGISAEDVAALRDIRDEISDSISICFSLEKRQRWLRAFDALTRNAFK